MNSNGLDSTGSVSDPNLERRRVGYVEKLSELGGVSGVLESLSFGHHFFGFTRGEVEGVRGVWYREWAPNAVILAIAGDFNDWDRHRHTMQRDEYGVWSVFLPIPPEELHGRYAKVHVRGRDGSTLDRIPAYAQRVTQDWGTGDFKAQIWLPEPFHWQHAPVGERDPRELRIYETHIGMATEEYRIGHFSEFQQQVLPRIADLGYNAIQIMAIQEHPYYGSFGYHVSSLFAVSSRFGEPEELKQLIDAAHGMGIRVLLDVVHSHAVKNLHEGLNRFDGTDYQYFHAGPRGDHAAWDSKVFDYSKHEVKRLLLSNVRFWLEEFHFDGFRFDGVTSILYNDHGLQKEMWTMDDYFGGNVDEDGLLYLQLANEVAHAIRPDVITIAEDVSGMPGIARPTSEGGIGFDYRLSMGVPDFWIKQVKLKKDEDWHLGDIWYELLNRRRDEKHVGYAESHDQALVGDQTLAFRMIGSLMYTHMANGAHDIVVDRGVALLKLIRLLTFSLSGEAWLSFMGNEFGHPEWVDFPREGNGWSFHHARRQWSLVDNGYLVYPRINNFDKALMKLDATHQVMAATDIELLLLDEARKVLVYRRGPLVFAVNLHPTESYSDLRVPCPEQVHYEAIMSTDSSEFAGFDRAQAKSMHYWESVEWGGRGQSIRLYLPSRTGLVLAPT